MKHHLDDDFDADMQRTALKHVPQQAPAPMALDTEGHKVLQPLAQPANKKKRKAQEKRIVSKQKTQQSALMNGSKDKT